MYIGFPDGSDSKESACNAREPGSVPGLGRYPGEGNGNPLQYSCLENFMDRGAWGQQSMWSQSHTQLSMHTHKVNKTWTALLSLFYSFWYLHFCILVSLEEKWGRESNICCVFATCQTLYLFMILFSVRVILFRVSLVAQLVKNLPAMRETWVRSLGWEDTLEKGKATHSSILAWSITWMYSLWGAKSWLKA